MTALSCDARLGRARGCRADNSDAADRHSSPGMTTRTTGIANSSPRQIDRDDPLDPGSGQERQQPNADRR